MPYDIFTTMHVLVPQVEVARVIHSAPTYTVMLHATV